MTITLKNLSLQKALEASSFMGSNHELFNNSFDFGTDVYWIGIDPDHGHDWNHGLYFDHNHDRDFDFCHFDLDLGLNNLCFDHVGDYCWCNIHARQIRDYRGCSSPWMAAFDLNWLKTVRWPLKPARELEAGSAKAEGRSPPYMTSH